MNLTGEIILNSVNYHYIEYKFGSVIRDNNIIFLMIGKLLHKFELDNYPDKLNYIDWNEILNFKCIGVFSEDTDLVIVSVNPNDYLILNFLNFGKIIRILLPTKNNETYSISIFFRKFSIILVVDNNLIYKWNTNTIIDQVTENNLDLIKEGQWSYIYAFKTKKENLHLIDTKLTEYKSNEIIFGPTFIVSSIYYSCVENSLFCESCLIPVQCYYLDNFKIFRKKILHFPILEDKNFEENICNLLIQMSFCTFSPILSIAVNGKYLGYAQSIVFLNIICNSISVVELDFQNSIIYDIKWDSTGNFLFGFTYDRFIFCCTRLGTTANIDLYNGNQYLGSGSLVSPFQYQRNNHSGNADGYPISSYCENTRIVFSFQKEIVNFKIKCKNQAQETLRIENIISELMYKNTKSFLTMCSEITETEVQNLAKVFLYEDLKSSKFLKDYNAFFDFQSNFHSFLGFIFSANFKDKEFDVHFIDSAIELLIKYLFWLIKCLSSTIDDLDLKIQFILFSLKNIFSHLLKFDAIWNFSVESILQVNSHFLQALRKLDLNNDQNAITVFFLIAEIMKLFAKSFLKIYTHFQSSQSDLISFCIRHSYDKDSTCKNSYYLPKISMSFENLIYVGNNFLNHFSDHEVMLFYQLKKWYRKFLSTFSIVPVVIYPIKLLYVEDYNMLLNRYSSEIIDLSGQGFKIYSTNCYKKLLSIMSVLILKGDLETCLEMISILSTLTSFSVEKSSSILQFFNYFSTDLNGNKIKSQCKKSPVIQSMSRFMAAYFSDKAVFLFHPDKPRSITSVNMENQKGLTIYISNHQIKEWISDNSDCKFTLDCCFNLLMVCGLYYESLELSSFLNDWKTYQAVLQICQINDQLKTKTEFRKATEISCQLTLENMIKTAIENLILNLSDKPSFNILIEIVKIRELLAEDTLIKILWIILNEFMIPIVKGMSFIVTDDIYLPCPPVYSTPNLNANLYYDFDSNEVDIELKNRRDLFNLISIFLTVMEMVDTLPAILDVFIRSFSNLSTLKKTVLGSLEQYLLEGQNKIIDISLTEVLKDFLFLLFYLHLRDNATIALRNRKKVMNEEYQSWLESSRQLFLSLEKLLYFENFLENGNFLRSNILIVLMEFEPELSIIEFLVKWDFNEKYFQQKLDLYSNMLLKKLINKFRFHELQGDHFLLKEDNNFLGFNNKPVRKKNFSVIYYEMLFRNNEKCKENGESKIEENGNRMEQFVSNISNRDEFISYLDLFFSIKFYEQIKRRNSNIVHLDKDRKLKEPIKTANLFDGEHLRSTITSLIRWSNENENPILLNKILLNYDVILSSLLDF